MEAEAPKSYAAQPRKRRRPALSCVECRRRKVKCDREDPCDSCKKFQSPTCTYSPRGVSSRINNASRSTVPSPSTRGASGDNAKADNDDLGARLRGISTSPQTLSNNATSDSEQLLSVSHSIGPGQNDQTLAQRVRKIEHILSVTGKIGSPVVDVSRSNELPAKGFKGSMVKNRYFGHGHWKSAMSEAESFMCFEIDPEYENGMKLMKDKEAEGAINSALNSCKMIARAIKAAQTPQWTVWGVSFQHSMPVRSVADELVGHYLRTHESTHRILHIPSFKKEYEQYWASPQSASTVSLIKIILVMAIGTVFHQGSDFDIHRTQAVQWVYTAQSWLASPREKSRLHTASLQVECLLLLARSIYNIGADILWNHTGSVLRTAISMGFHRDPKNFKQYSILRNEVRRRLWATILEINVQACLDSGMPPMISLDDFDSEPPSNINDEEINELTTTRPVSRPPQAFTQSSVQIALLSSLPTRLDAAKLVYEYHLESSYDEMIRLDKVLSRNVNENHALFARAAQDPSATVRPTAFHRKTFDLYIQRFLLVLHRPFAIKARSDSRFYYSHKICLDTAVAVHSVPSHYSAAYPGNETQDDYARFRIIDGGFLREVLIQSTILLYQEVIMPLEEGLPAFSQEESKSRRQLYARLLHEMVDLSCKRLAAAETSVKSHLIFSIMVAHVEVLEHGTSSQEAMVEAAKSSLAQAAELLKRRIPASLEDQFPEALGEIPDLDDGDMDLSMQDWGMELEPSDSSWLFPGWPMGSIR